MATFLAAFGGCEACGLYGLQPEFPGGVNSQSSGYIQCHVAATSLETSSLDQGIFEGLNGQPCQKFIQRIGYVPFPSATQVRAAAHFLKKVVERIQTKVPQVF